MKVKLLAGLLFGTAAMAAQGIPPGLSVQYKDGKIGITAKDQSVRQILEDVSKKAGFEIVGADLLPEDRVTMVLDPSPVKFEIADILSLAPKLNYVVVYGSDVARPIVKITLFPREGGTGIMNVQGAADMGGRGAPPPPPPPPSMPMGNSGDQPRYIPPEHPPQYIPPDEPPVYIPPDEPPRYIPADGPPQYIPPAPPANPPGGTGTPPGTPPGGDPNTPPQTPPQDPNNP